MKAIVLKTVVGTIVVAALAALPLTATTEHVRSIIPDGITSATPPETPIKQKGNTKKQKDNTKKQKTKKEKKSSRQKRTTSTENSKA